MSRRSILFSVGMILMIIVIGLTAIQFRYVERKVTY